MKEKLLTSYDNFLDIQLISQINSYAETSKNDPVWKTSHVWSEEIKRQTSPVAILPLPDGFNNRIRTRLKETGLTWKDDNPPQRSKYYLYPPGGYIGWHDDSRYEFASIIFLNSMWNLDWGGLLLYEDLTDLGIRAAVPTFNTCIINGGGVPHGVSITSPDAPLRCVIITFGPFIPEEERNKANSNWQSWRKKRNMKW